MLIDIHKFWAYDNRESISSAGGSDVDEGEEEPTLSSNVSSTYSVSSSVPLTQSSKPRLNFHEDPNTLDDDPYDF